MGANYSFEVKNIEIWAPAFFKHNNSFIATVDNLEVSKIMSPNSDFYEFIYRVYYEFNEKFFIKFRWPYKKNWADDKQTSWRQSPLVG